MEINEIVERFEDKLNNSDLSITNEIDSKNYSIDKAKNEFRFKLKKGNSFASITVALVNNSIDVINTQLGKDKLSGGLQTVLYSCYAETRSDLSDSYISNIHKNKKDKKKANNKQNIIEKLSLEKEGEANNLKRFFIISRDKDGIDKLNAILSNKDNSFKYKKFSNDDGKCRWDIISNDKSFSLSINKGNVLFDDDRRVMFIIIETNDRYMFYSYL